MAANPRQQLHDFVDRLTTDEAERLFASLCRHESSERVPRPLTEADILLRRPILPDEETADELNATVRRWRREGGYA